MIDIPEKCQRCDEPILPRAQRPGLVPRFFGQIERVAVNVTWTSWAERWSARLGTAEGPDQVTFTEVYLCDGCWGGLLSWVNAPIQERAKIAAENRRYAERVAKVTEERRERQVQRHMDDLESEGPERCTRCGVDLRYPTARHLLDCLEPGGSQHG